MCEEKANAMNMFKFRFLFIATTMMNVFKVNRESVKNCVVKLNKSYCSRGLFVVSYL